MEEKIISVTPISKEENLYSRLVWNKDGTLVYDDGGKPWEVSYVRVAAMATVENGIGFDIDETESSVKYLTVWNRSELCSEYYLGYVDEENNTFEPLVRQMNFDVNGKQQVSPYILLNSVEEIACDRFGNVVEQIN